MRAKRNQDYKVISKFQRLQEEKANSTAQSQARVKPDLLASQDYAEENLEVTSVVAESCMDPLPFKYLL